MLQPLAPEYGHAIVKNAVDACVTELPYGELPHEVPVVYQFTRTPLTPCGDAAVALYRFLDVVRGLEPVDRAYIVAMLGDELRPMIADLATA